MKRPTVLIPALRALLAITLVILLAEVVFRRYLVPILGVRLTDTPDFRQWPEMLYLGVLFPVVMASLALFLHRFLDRRPWQEFGLGIDRRARRVTVAGAALMSAGYGAFIGITGLADLLRWSIAPSVTWRFLLTASATYLGTGLWEEFFFRGYLYRTLKAYGKPVAYVVSIALFSLIHFTEEPLILPRVLNLLLVSFFLTYIYDRSNSIWPGVILHGGWNLLSFLTVSNQLRVTPLSVQGPAGGAIRWFSTVLHLLLTALVWRSYRSASGTCHTADQDR